MIINALQWRYACKKFNSSKKVSEEIILKLKQSVDLTATAYGLQPFEVIDVRDSEIRKQLQPVSWGQSQIVDASHLFVFCQNLSITKEMIAKFIEEKAKSWETTVEKIDFYREKMEENLLTLSPKKMKEWAGKQAYIAMGTLLATCGDLQIDSCPIEGFEPEKYDQILNLQDKNLHSCVVVAIGYRADDDAQQFRNKTRKGVEKLFWKI